ncbi:uncharacterized protein cubi_00474 [Cryptosporidium ubiquitum]|uniref:Uncharacterized protein n=1 Tax=Cryptosporidium ubiquitum TaxID=857276 RepID=A0A1J4MEQ4_9CRYT|nr:uncharacterized protein cubi_00474 [Cryptosporidium ubiquitum]OII72479.1 hypothetical protein cubi_00474 [Cryptosporidium ubiquitum]
MNKSLLIYYFFIIVVILISINGSSLGKKKNLVDYEECENPEYFFPWGNDYMNACLSFQCHKVREHKNWYRFWDRKPKYIHNNINGNEQVIQCSDCEGFLKKGALFGGMSLCTPLEFGGNFDTPKGWVSVATANLQLNKEIKNKSSIKLIPDNWRIDGETAKSTLDLSKCSISEEDSAVALSIIVTLSNIHESSKKLPKYRGILGLSDDSINVRIKTLGIDMEKSMDGPDNDLDEDEFDDDEYESEDLQQSMVQDDDYNEYLLYDMNKMVSTHHRIPRDSSNTKAKNKKRNVKKQKPFTGAEKLPTKWKLSKGQTSIYSSSDIVRLDLASGLHPNDLVEVILTCNNKYMNCNIQGFASCFNILCKSVTKEELIRRAALKKAKQFISNSIITGRIKPIMNYNDIQFQQSFPPTNTGPINMQSQYQNANVPVRGANYGVPKMVFVNNGAQNMNIGNQVGTSGILNGFVQQPVNTMTSQNVTVPNVFRISVVPNQTQANTHYQGSNNLVSIKTVAKTQQSKKEQKKPNIHKLMIVNNKSDVQNQFNTATNPPQKNQYVLKARVDMIQTPEPTTTPTNSNYIVNGLNCNGGQAPVEYNLLLNPKLSTTCEQVSKPKSVRASYIVNQNPTNPVDKPQTINIKLQQPPALRPKKKTAKIPDTIKLNVVLPTTTTTPVPVQIKLVNAGKPIQAKKMVNMVSKVDKNEVKQVKKPQNNIVLRCNLNIESEKVDKNCNHVFKPKKVKETPEPKVVKIVVENAPSKTNKTFKSNKSGSDKVIEARIVENVNERKSGKKVLNLVPKYTSSRDNKDTLSSDLNYNSDNLNGKVRRKKTPSPSSDIKIIIEEPKKAKPLKENTTKKVYSSSKKDLYVLKKTLPSKEKKYVKHTNNVIKYKDVVPDDYVEFEVEIDEVEDLNEDESDTLILKKVSRNKDYKKPVKPTKSEIDFIVNVEPLQKEMNKNNIDIREKTEFKDERIEQPESGVKIDNSSLIDSSVYENNNKYKNHNETITGKYILGYSILISVFLFTVFIVIKLFLL